MAGDTATIEEARARFAAFRKDHNSLNPNLRRAVYGIAAAMGGYEAQEILRSLYKEFAMVQEEQNRLLGAMTESQDPALLTRALEYFISGEVRAQNVFPLMGQVAANPAGTDLAWEFLKHRWDAFVALYEKGTMLTRTIENVCNMLVGPGYEDDVAAFFAAHPVAEAERTIAQSLERIRVNTRWLARDGAVIASWLCDHYGPPSGALGTFFA
jgi:aminopeptidase 2